MVFGSSPGAEGWRCIRRCGGQPLGGSPLGEGVKGCSEPWPKLLQVWSEQQLTPQVGCEIGRGQIDQGGKAECCAG